MSSTVFNPSFLGHKYECFNRTKTWVSLCEQDGHEKDWCDAKVLPNITLLFIGNSYIRQTMQSYILLHSEEIVNLQVCDDVKNFTFHPCQMVGCRNGLSTTNFRSGGIIHTVANHHINWNMYTGKGLNVLLDTLDAKLDDMTNILMNRGNEVAWASKHGLWSDADTVNYGNQTHLHNMCSTFEYLVERNYKGKFTMVSSSFGADPIVPKTICPHIDFDKPIPFSLDTLYLGMFTAGKQSCSVPHCGKDSGHVCIPGPPEDAFRMILHKSSNITSAYMSSNITSAYMVTGPVDRDDAFAFEGITHTLSGAIIVMIFVFLCIQCSKSVGELNIYIYLSRVVAYCSSLLLACCYNYKYTLGGNNLVFWWGRSYDSSAR